MTGGSDSPSVRRLARDLADLKVTVRRLATSPRLAYSSIEGGSIDGYDDDGNPTVNVGELPDGTTGVNPTGGPIPPTPSGFGVSGGIRALVIDWSGQFVGGVVAPLNFARIEIHVSEDPDFVPDLIGDAGLSSTLKGTIGTSRGGGLVIGGFDPPEDFVPGDPLVELYVRFVTRSTSGKYSAPSELYGPVSPVVIRKIEMPDFSVSEFDLEDFSISADKLQIGAVTSVAIAPSAVTSVAIAPSAVTSVAIAPSAVTSTEIAAAAITPGKIGASAVVAGTVATNAITTGTIVAGAVTANEIATNAITSVKISAGAVTTTALTAGAVTTNEIATNAITSVKISAGAVTTTALTAGAVTANEIGANAITSAKISANAVVAGTIATNAITTANIQAGAVQTANLLANAVTALTIDTNAVTALKVNTDAITAGKIAAGSITTTKIATGAITANEIAAGAITASKLSADAIDGKTITGVTISNAYVSIVSDNVRATSTTGSGWVTLSGTIGVGAGLKKPGIELNNGSGNGALWLDGQKLYFVIVSGGVYQALGEFHSGKLFADIYNDGTTTGATYGPSGQLIRTPVSSMRYKEDVRSAEHLSSVVDLDIFIHKYKDRETYGDQDFLGVSAEQAAELGLDPLYWTNREGKPEGIQYERIAVALIPEVRKLRDEVAGLRELVAQLTS